MSCSAGASGSSDRLTLRFVHSTRGGEVLLRAGHQYYKQKVHKSSSWWRCSNKKNGCSGSVTLNFDKSRILRETRHVDSCIPNFEKNEVKLVMEKCKLQICKDLKPIPATFNDETVKLKDAGYEFISELPKFDKIKSSLYRHRNKYLGIKKSLHTNSTEVEIPKTCKEHIIFDDTLEGNRIIVLSSKITLNKIEHVRHFFADGTFKCCPKPFYQLYIIYGDLGSTENSTNIIPFFYALLSNKEEVTYQRMFSGILRNVPDWKPEKFTLDFEKAPMNVIKKIFPQTIVKGCFVHFSRAILRKAKSLGLLEHVESHNHIKLCMALANLPREDICEGWLYIMSHR